MYINFFYNIKAIFINSFINILLFIDIFYNNPSIKNYITILQNKSIESINYSLLIDLSNNIQKKYNINIFDIGSKLKDFYNKSLIVNDDDNFSELSSLSEFSDNYSDLSDLSYLSDISDL